MNISNWCKYKVEDLENMSTYASLYLCLKKIRKHNVKDIETVEKLKVLLDDLYQKDVKQLYIKEQLLVKEYLQHNQTAEVPYYAEDMLDMKLENGVMNETTAQLLIDYDGLAPDEYEQFMSKLFSEITNEVFALYEEIERNLDGKYGVSYDELY